MSENSSNQELAKQHLKRIMEKRRQTDPRGYGHDGTIYFELYLFHLVMQELKRITSFSYI